MSGACIALCADDLGLHEAVTGGVLALAGKGRLNGVSCMVGAPAWAGARLEVRALAAAGVDVGLHLDLTEHPLDAGRRASLPRLALAASLRQLPEFAIEREITRQFDRFEQDVGRAPDYVDGHQHVHQLPQVRDALLWVIAQRGQQPWLRSTRRQPRLRAPDQASLAERIKPRVIEALGARALERAAAGARLACNRHLLGVYGFDADAPRYRDWIGRWLAAASDDDVLCCHPGLWGGGEVPSGDAIALARAVECSVLASDWMTQCLSDHGITLVRLGRLVQPAARTLPLQA